MNSYPFGDKAACALLRSSDDSQSSADLLSDIVAMSDLKRCVLDNFDVYGKHGYENPSLPKLVKMLNTAMISACENLVNKMESR